MNVPAQCSGGGRVSCLLLCLFTLTDGIRPTYLAESHLLCSGYYFKDEFHPKTFWQTLPEIMVNQISENSVAERAANLITKSNNYSRCFTQNKIIFHKRTSSAGAEYVWKSVG